MLPIVLIIFIGRFYDDRLQLMGVELSIPITIIYMFSIAIAVRFTTCRNPLNNGYTILLLCFASVLALSYVITPYVSYQSNNYAFDKLIEFITITLSISLLFAYTINSAQYLYFIRVLLFICLMFIAMGCIKIMGNAKYDDLNRLSVMGGGPIVFARWVLTGALITIVLFKKKWGLKLAVVGVCFYLSLLAGSKGPILGFIIALLFYGFILVKNNISVQKITMLLAAGLFFIGGVFVAIQLNIIPSRLAALTNVDELIASSSFLSRFDRVTNTAVLITNNPMGVGLGNWAQEFNWYTNTYLDLDDYPHNIFIEIIVETGLLGLLLFMSIIVYPLYKYFKYSTKFKDNNNYVLLPILIVFSLVNASFSGDLSDARLLFILSTILFTLTTFHTSNNELN